MLNSNKVSEIKIIVADLLQDLDSMVDMESVSPLKWEELNMAADNIKRKINTLMIEHERYNLLKLKQAISELSKSHQEPNSGIYRHQDNYSKPVEITPKPVDIFSKPTEMFTKPAEVYTKPVEEEEIELFQDTRSSIMDIPKRNNISWKGNILGPKVDDLNSAITLNDKLFFIKALFNNDEDQYKLSIQRLNEMRSMDEALEYTRAAFPDWDEESNTIFRFYMILRRRFDA